MAALIVVHFEPAQLLPKRRSGNDRQRHAVLLQVVLVAEKSVKLGSLEDLNLSGAIDEGDRECDEVEDHERLSDNGYEGAKLGLVHATALVIHAHWMTKDVQRDKEIDDFTHLQILFFNY